MSNRFFNKTTVRSEMPPTQITNLSNQETDMDPGNERESREKTICCVIPYVSSSFSICITYTNERPLVMLRAESSSSLFIQTRKESTMISINDLCGS